MGHSGVKFTHINYFYIECLRPEEMLESEVSDATYSHSYICKLCVVTAFVKKKKKL